MGIKINYDQVPSTSKGITRNITKQKQPSKKSNESIAKKQDPADILSEAQARLKSKIVVCGSLEQMRYTRLPLYLRVISNPWTAPSGVKHSVWVEDSSLEGRGQSIMMTWTDPDNSTGQEFPDFIERFGRIGEVFTVSGWECHHYSKSYVSEYQVQLESGSGVQKVDNEVLKSIGGLPFRPMKNLKEFKSDLVVTGRDQYVDLRVYVDKVFEEKRGFIVLNSRMKTVDKVVIVGIRIECDNSVIDVNEASEKLEHKWVKIRSATVIEVVPFKSITVQKPILGIEPSEA